MGTSYLSQQNTAFNPKPAKPGLTFNEVKPPVNKVENQNALGPQADANSALNQSQEPVAYQQQAGQSSESYANGVATGQQKANTNGFVDAKSTPASTSSSSATSQYDPNAGKITLGDSFVGSTAGAGAGGALENKQSTDGMSDLEALAAYKASQQGIQDQSEQSMEGMSDLEALAAAMANGQGGDMQGDASEQQGIYWQGEDFNGGLGSELGQGDALGANAGDTPAIEDEQFVEDVIDDQSDTGGLGKAGGALTEAEAFGTDPYTGGQGSADYYTDEETSNLNPNAPIAGTNWNEQQLSGLVGDDIRQGLKDTSSDVWERMLQQGQGDIRKRLGTGMSNLSDELSARGLGASGQYFQGLGELQTGAMNEAAKLAVDVKKQEVDTALQKLQQTLAFQGTAMSDETKRDLANQAAALEQQKLKLQEDEQRFNQQQAALDSMTAIASNLEKLGWSKEQGSAVLTNAMRQLTDANMPLTAENLMAKVFVLIGEGKGAIDDAQAGAKKGYAPNNNVPGDNDADPNEVSQKATYDPATGKHGVTHTYDDGSTKTEWDDGTVTQTGPTK